jgi:gamma-glutamyltranspeptidase/glutathione hydrolase
MFDSFARPNYHTAGHLHLVAEIEKRVFADRTAYEGDADFVNVPSAALIDKSYCRRRADGIDPNRKSDPSRIESGLGPTPLPLKARHESPQTTHFSIVDREGMAVANTTTLNDGYGSGIVVPGAGFLLNNEMDDFSAKPGARNLYGVTGGTANQIEPGKRMLSSMCPTFVYRPDGKLWLVLGTPGGSTIFTTVFQVIVNRIDYGMNLDEAVRTQRFHHQWPPPIGSDPIQIEKAGGGGLRTGTVDELARLGYSIKWRGAIGQVQAIEIDANHAVGAADPRGIGVVERD